MRILNVGNENLLLRDTDAEELARDDVIYPCGDPDHDHDYHINPEDKRLDSVERLVIAVAKALTQSPSLEDIGITTVTMNGEITPDQVQKLSEEKLASRVSYLQRNLSLNLATTAAKRGLFEATSFTEQETGKLKISVSATIIPPQLRKNFVYLAKTHVIRLIAAMPGVSDQRKDEVIALIKSA